MANMTNYLERKLLDHLLGVEPYAVPTLHLALFKTQPTEAGSGDEVDELSYERVTITFDEATTDVSDVTTALNALSVTFPEAQEDWGTVTYIAIYDAATSGNMLLYGEVSNPRMVEEGDIVTFTAGSVEVELQ